MPPEETRPDGGPAARLERLVEANRLIMAELSLDGVLRRVVESARAIVSAQYAALGVVGYDGGLEQFVHSGMDRETVLAIGDLPKGRGLLGAVTDTGSTVRLESVAADGRSSGVPLDHPALTSFLGVPIRTAAGVYGNLYLANPVGRPAFSTEDENLIRSLASTAGTAVTNAQNYTEALQRHEWLRVSSEVSQRLMAEDEDTASMLAGLARSAQQIARAAGVLITLPVVRTPRTLEIVATSGEGVEQYRGIRFDASGSLSWQAMQLGEPLVVQDVHAYLKEAPHLPLPMPINHVMVVPLLGRDTVRGTVTVGRTKDWPFTENDKELAQAFAVQATLTLEMADARADQQRIAMLEERARMAHNLHDNVVQRLFAAGLTIQGASGLSTDPAVRQQLATAVENLDETIRTLRTSIFDIEPSVDAVPPLAGRILAVVVEMTAMLGFTPVLEVTGSVELVTDPELTSDVEAALRAALIEVAQHANATSVRVDVDVDGLMLTLIVTDNGSTPLASRPSPGLDELQRRAEERSGALALSDIGGGAQLFWSVPLA
ncbi:GAF domain-containing protein [uncultured Friedmanniella sp.]|uniref:sensor histidine kinase n=1 Tax=uncultured Friedmanniella sp. TaxID=335381 RepID=UPI0035C97D32